VVWLLDPIALFFTLLLWLSRHMSTVSVSPLSSNPETAARPAVHVKSSPEPTASSCLVTVTQSGAWSPLRPKLHCLMVACLNRCGPCLMMSNVLTVVSKSLRGAITCVKLDADKYPGLASRYKIKALPTLVLFKVSCVPRRLLAQEDASGSLLSRSSAFAMSDVRSLMRCRPPCRYLSV